MIQFILYKRILRGIAYFLLVGQLWASVISHSHWMIDFESELIELCDSQESETEEIDKKDKDDEIRIDSVTPLLSFTITTARLSSIKNYSSINHPEITTPPPESFLSLS